MKKILIVDKSYAVGGIQTALINLVKEIKNKYDIDVLMFYNDGPLKFRMPEDVNVIRPSRIVRLFGMSLSDSKKCGKFTYIVRSFIGFLCKTFTNRAVFAFALLFQKKLKGYDAVLAFHHEPSPKATVAGFYRFVDKKTDAPLKLGWIHYDSAMIPYDDKVNEKYMNRMDKLVCVSKGTADSFLSRHPGLKVPVEFCYNMHDVNRVLSLSEENPPVSLDKTKFNCFSACRLAPQKAIARAVRAFAPVLKANPEIVWYVAGEGNERKEIEKEIADAGLENSVVLLGQLSNPYPMFKNCDLYILPSVYEAAPMSYGEAMICKIPILTTDNISASEMVPREYGVICENSEEGLRRALETLASDRELVKTMKRNYDSFDFTNSKAVVSFDEILFG